MRSGQPRGLVAACLAATLVVACSNGDEQADDIVDLSEDGGAEPDEGDDVDDGGVDGADEGDADDSDAGTDEADGSDADGEDADGQLALDEVPTDAERIDADLVQRALDVLDVRIGELFAAAVDEGVTEETVALADAVYGDAELAAITQRLDTDWIEYLHDEPGPPVSEVVELRTVTADCVNAVVERDMSAVTDEAGDPDRLWSISLVPIGTGDDEVVWRIAQENIGDEEPPSDRCTQIGGSS